MKAAAYLLSNERQATQQTAPENMMSYGCENLNTIIKWKIYKYKCLICFVCKTLKLAAENRK